MEEKNEVAVVEQPKPVPVEVKPEVKATPAVPPVVPNEVAEERARVQLLMDKARIYANSNFLPKAIFQFEGAKEKAVANIVIAMQMAEEVGLDAFTFMRGCYDCHGSIGFKADLQTALFNVLVNKGVWTPMTCIVDRDENGVALSAHCEATHVKTGIKCVGETVSLKTAKDNHWGAQWTTNPEHMLRLRSKSWFIRDYAPEAMMGYEESELLDIEASENSKKKATATKGTKALSDIIGENTK